MSTTVAQHNPNRTLGGSGFGADERELLENYIALSPSERRKRFAPTSLTARQFGIPQRTLQAWIEAGLVGALRIGTNYRVYVPSVEVYLRGCNGNER
jgi:hypothetical protein